MVHDLVYLRDGAAWRLHKSVYPKLRLPVAWTRDAVTRAGLRVDSCEVTRGLVTLAATRTT